MRMLLVYHTPCQEIEQNGTISNNTGRCAADARKYNEEKRRAACVHCAFFDTFLPFLPAQAVEWTAAGFVL